VVDNTFTPMVVTPKDLGADVVVHSLTKYINGKSDCIAGAICADHDFINSISDVNTGISMLLGPVLDPLRSASIHKNLFTLHIRMQKHSQNAAFIAQKFLEKGARVSYPGLTTHRQHELMKNMMNEGYGFGGIFSIDMETKEKANDFMVGMQQRHLGYLAVSLGYYKTLFSNSGTSTSSEIPEEVQKGMGLSPGLVRISIGLDQNIGQTWQGMEEAYDEAVR
jgi:methionine-gamma-lyase